MNPEETDRLLESLIGALAAQCADGLTPRAREHLENLTRDQALTIFGMAGHDLHYGGDDPGLRHLVQATSDILRAESDETAAFRPGDAVRVVGDMPPAFADYDQASVRESIFLVRYVGDDGSVDIQFDPSDDFLIETVPAGSLAIASA